jgi:alcohol dehydrogenase class IV
MNSLNFDYHLFGTHVRFGLGAVEALPNEMAALGCTRPIVLMQQRMADSAVWAQVKTFLHQVTPHIYTTVPAHGSVEWIETVAESLHDQRCDGIIALGGGSVSDSAKALAMLLAEGGQLADHVTRFIPPSTVEIPVRTRPKLPIIALPTTASGAEVTPSFGARRGTKKLLFWNRDLAAKTVIIDPNLARDIPLPRLRTTAMNGLAHCFEGMYSRNRSSMADAIALQSIELFAKALTTDTLNDDEQRALLMAAGHLSGVVLSMAKTCLHHAICHVIGGRYAVGHGEVNSVILPHALRFNHAVTADTLAPALAILNRVAKTHHENVADWVADIGQQLALPTRLSELGLVDEDLLIIAEQTMHERGLAVNPYPVTHSDQVLTILRQAL